MKLSDNAILEFKKIYLKKFGVELSPDVANKLGIELLNFFNLIYKQISRTPANLSVALAKRGKNE